MATNLTEGRLARQNDGGADEYLSLLSELTQTPDAERQAHKRLVALARKAERRVPAVS